MGKTLVIGGEEVEIIGAPISGDVNITHDSVSSIPDGVITVDMLSSALKAEIFPVLIIGQGKIGYSTIG